MQSKNIVHLGILEDDEFQTSIYRVLFPQDSYSCEFFESISAFLEAVKHKKFDLFIIDWMLPDGNAEEAVKWIRKNISQRIPVICVTARNEERDVVHVLKLGADDYFVKSSRNFELLARVEALIRRARLEQPKIFHFGPYEVDSTNYRMSLGGTNINLTRKEFDLASYLFQHSNKLLSRIHLLEKIWGTSAGIDTRTVDTHISRIRHKLELSVQSNWDIVTVYGYGYRLQPVQDNNVLQELNQS